MPTFPPSGDLRVDSIKQKAGYVEYVVFEDQGGGYFCGTCAAFQQISDRFGWCAGLHVNVQSYGCCNNWRIAIRRAWVGADGGSI